MIATLDGGDARKGQEKGNVLEGCRIAKCEASKALNSQHLIGSCTRVCATDPLVLTRWWIDHEGCAHRGERDRLPGRLTDHN